MNEEKFILELLDLLRRHELIDNEDPKELTLRVVDCGIALTVRYLYAKE